METTERLFGSMSYDDSCLPSATRVVRLPQNTLAYTELFAHDHGNFKDLLLRASQFYPFHLASIERKKTQRKKTSKRAGASKQNNKGPSKAQVQNREMDCFDHKHAHSSDSEQDQDQYYVDHSDPDSESEFESHMMRENDSFYIDPGDYLISATTTTKTSSQQQPGRQLIHTDSLKTSSDIRQCEQDSEVKCGDISPAEKLGSKRSLRASLGGKDKPSDSVDTVNLKIFNTVPSGPKTNFSTMSTPHNQAHSDSLTASPPTAPQKAPLLQFFGVHENQA
jgi:hypothetical protein